MSDTPEIPDNTARSLVDKAYWDDTWEKAQLPVVVEPEAYTRRERRAQEIIESYLRAEPRTLLEIGGAPGGITGYYARTFGCKAHILEYSGIGCDKTQENFKLLGLDVTVYHRDFLGDLSDLPRFDVVMSAGFIEHFPDLLDVWARHVSLLKPGGLLVVSVPNFAGMYQYVLRKTAPRMLSRHNLEAMDLRNWRPLERKLSMEILFVGYIGGFYPGALQRCETRTFFNVALRTFFKTLNSVTKRLPFLRLFNSPLWSQRLLGIYRKPSSSCGDFGSPSRC